MQTNFQITVTFCGICEENWDIYRTESLKDLHQKHFSFRILTLLFIISMLFITLRYRYSKENPTILSLSQFLSCSYFWRNSNLIVVTELFS